MNKKIFEAVNKIVKEVMEKESPVLNKNRTVTLDKTSSFMESLEIDSLLALEMVSKIEKKFRIQLQEEDFVHFSSMEDIAEFIEQRIGGKDISSGNKKIKANKDNTSGRSKPPRIIRRNKKKAR